MSTTAEVPPPGRVTIVVTKGFAVPCIFYLMVGLALYPQLGVIAGMVGITLVGQPSTVEWIFAGIYFMLIGIGSVIVHEIGHALVIKYVHRRNSVVALAAQVGTRHAPLKGNSRLMALGGPALQGLYGAFVLALCIPTSAFYFSILGYYIIFDAFYNLLPFPNYDGYHVFRKQTAPEPV